MDAQLRQFLKEFPRAAADDAAAVFVGAGISKGAGYPTWKELLTDIAEELGVDGNDIQDLAALAQWSIQQNTSKTRILKVIKELIGVNHAVPLALQIVSRMPVRNVWTTNFDKLIERAYQQIGRPTDTISEDEDLALRPNPGAVRIYKMHGDVERPNSLVISTDDYELYKRNKGAFLPILQAHLTSFSMLFIGISFSDPNIRHVLSLIRDSFTTSPPEHYAIVRCPQQSDFKSKEEFSSKLTQHKLWAQDLRRYGLIAIEVEAFEDIPKLLRTVERRIASRRVWVSGSWPPEHAEVGRVTELAEGLGLLIGQSHLALVTGSGLTIGAGVVAGFLSSLQASGSWDLERRLIVRPFPQPKVGEKPDREQWSALRQEMARIAGIVIFVGGVKSIDGVLVDADGVEAEYNLAEEWGGYLLPIGSLGGKAKLLAEALIGSPLAHAGSSARRPHDKELKALRDEVSTPKILQIVKTILDRIIKAQDS